MLGWMLGGLMGTASHANARVDAFRDARAAMQMMERDLRNLVRTQWNPDPLRIRHHCLAKLRRYQQPASHCQLPILRLDSGRIYGSGHDPNRNQQLYALIADRTSGPSGDVCRVGYYCRWDDQLHTYSLRRFFRDSASTFTAIQGAREYAGASVLYTPGSSDAVLAAYVWNLRIKLYDAAGTQYATDPVFAIFRRRVPGNCPPRSKFPLTP